MAPERVEPGGIAIVRADDADVREGPQGAHVEVGDIAGADEGDTVLIGDPANAVVFDFKPGIDAGAQTLGRRGEDERLREDRPAADRRRAIQEAMPERGETEVRADVARRLDTSSTPGDVEAEEDEA